MLWPFKTKKKKKEYIHYVFVNISCFLGLFFFYFFLTQQTVKIEIVTDLDSISPLMIVGAWGVNRGGGRGVRQDVDEVWIHHVVVKQVKDSHPIRSI